MLEVREEQGVVLLRLDCICDWGLTGFGGCDHLLCGPGHVRCKLRDIIIIMSYVVGSVMGIDTCDRLVRDMRDERAPSSDLSNMLYVVSLVERSDEKK